MSFFVPPFSIIMRIKVCIAMWFLTSAGYFPLCFWQHCTYRASCDGGGGQLEQRLIIIHKLQIQILMFHSKTNQVSNCPHIIHLRTNQVSNYPHIFHLSSNQVSNYPHIFHLRMNQVSNCSQKEGKVSRKSSDSDEVPTPMLL